MQSLAVVRLLEENRYETAPPLRAHYSTLVQQTLSLLAQYGSARPSQLWHLLCGTEPYSVSQQNYLTLLKGLSGRQILRRGEDSEVALTEKGWSIADSPGFCTAFGQKRSCRLVSEGSFIGLLPEDEPLEICQRILFGGRAWQVLSLDNTEHVIQLKPDTEGMPPPFAGAGSQVDDEVRRVKLDLYRGGHVAGTVSAAARAMLREGRKTFDKLNLDSAQVLVGFSRLCLLPWRGDRFCRTVAALLRLAGLDAGGYAGLVELRDCELRNFRKAAEKLLADGRPQASALTQRLHESLLEKFAPYVESSLLAEDTLQRFYVFEEAWTWLGKLLSGSMAEKISFF